MIYVTGDIHGKIFQRFNPLLMPGEDTWTPDDKLIVTGDFGLIFYPRMDVFLQDEIVEEQRQLAYLEKKPYEILFVDGNHENFSRLTAEFPEEERYGGTVRRLGRNVFWLQRGQIYTIEGNTFFCLGGAFSIDWREREPGVSWWPEEQPDGEDLRRAEKNLIANGRRVDYVLTHTAPQTLIREMGFTPDPQDWELTGFLDWIRSNVAFTHWYFGHWHLDRELGEKATALYWKVKEIPGTDRKDGESAPCGAD